MRTRSIVGAVIAAALSAAQVAVAQDGITVLPMPEVAAYPEGVAVDPTTGVLYVNSANTGVIVRIDPATGTTSIVGDPLNMAGALPATPKSIALGLKSDGEGQIWVAGGRTGTMHVVDIGSGRRLARFSTGGATLINDVVLTRDAAWFTDTLHPYLWRISRDAIADATLEPWLSFEGTALEYGEEPNLNGIAATADGRYLIVVQMKAGRLFRIDTQTKAVTRIDLGDESLDGGDGLVLDGRRLYLVRQWAGEIVAIDLSEDLTVGTVTKRISPPELAWPATAAISGDRLIVANSQLNRRASGDPVLPFSLVSIPLSAFD